MMHFCQTIGSIPELHSLLERDEVNREIEAARGILVQVFDGTGKNSDLADLTEAILKQMPRSVVLGVSSAGEISEGQVMTGGTVISISIFHSTDVIPFSVSVLPGGEWDAGVRIAEIAAERPDTVCLLLFAPALQVDCPRMLAAIAQHSPDLPVFGGGAAETPEGTSCVSLNGNIFERGAVGVALAGSDLHVDQKVLFDWQPLGPSVKLTGVNGASIRTIDHEPAIHLYERYLNIQHGEDLYLLEFPLLIERDGVLLARNPLTSDAAGAVRIVGDIYQGESARLGYLDVNSLLHTLRQTLQTCADFFPEAIFLYSCICRRFSLQQDTEMETAPFQGIAPTAGFFTYGEFCSLDAKLRLLNSSEVVVAMREGAARPSSRQAAAEFAPRVDSARGRHVLMTSRLFQFIAALTERVEASNRALASLAELDPLTGIGNRRALDRQLDFEIERSVRFQRNCSIVMLDLDYFKAVNDTFGHAAGDEVLKAVAFRVQSMIRNIDGVFRYGGEEFLVILPETPLSGAIIMAENARRAIAEMAFTFDGSPQSEPPQSITASFGVATFPVHGSDTATLLTMVDRALYRSKQLGRNRVSAAPVRELSPAATPDAPVVLDG